MKKRVRNYTADAVQKMDVVCAPDVGESHPVCVGGGGLVVWAILASLVAVRRACNFRRR